MRGFFLAGYLGLTALSAAACFHVDDLHAAERAKDVDPAYRLLELGGKTVRWVVPENGLPTTITYAFLTEPAQFPGARNCDSMLPPEAALTRSRIDMDAFRRETRAAFSAWEQAANITFKETSPAEAGILIGADAKARGRAFTNVALSESAHAQTSRGVGAIAQSLICFNPDQPWKIGFDGDLKVYDLRFTMTHEIGHAIGLDHPSPEGQLMSFRYVEKRRGLQPGDVAGALALYGQKGVGSAPSGSPAQRGVQSAQGAGERTFGLGEGTASELSR